MTRNYGNETGTPSPERTATQPHVIGVHAAVEQHTVATRALSEALRAAESAGATIELADLAELRLPLYDPDRTDPENAVALVKMISRADAVVLATSVRHDSYSALLKNALEYCDRGAFEDKPVGLLAVSEASGPALALEHLRTVCRTLGARVLPMQVSIDTTREGEEFPGESVDALRKLGRELVEER